MNLTRPSALFGPGFWRTERAYERRRPLDLPRADAEGHVELLERARADDAVGLEAVARLEALDRVDERAAVDFRVDIRVLRQIADALQSLRELRQRRVRLSRLERLHLRQRRLRPCLRREPAVRRQRRLQARVLVVRRLDGVEDRVRIGSDADLVEKVRQVVLLRLDVELEAEIARIDAADVEVGDV